MDITKIGKFIAVRRRCLGMTQQTLAEQLSITDKAVSKWERGLSFPDISLLGNLALALKCSIGEILNGNMNDAAESSNKPFISHNSKPLDFEETVTISLNENSDSIVSPYLFGNNLEHTRACVNGGISAQMLRNRKFAGKPGCIRKGCAEEWLPLGKAAYLSLGESYTRHNDGYHMKRNHECNAQDITDFEGGTLCGIAQEHLSIQKGEEYEFRIVARVYQPTCLNVTLKEGSRILCHKTIELTDREFREAKTVLRSEYSASDARLEIGFCERGTLSIGAVSLMPCHHFHGMRPDVIQCMKEMGITLLRWPGGNFAGEYNWKDGLLPTDMRAPLESFLGIETQPATMGYDFHEINTDDFIALCREIGAEPYITINPAWNTPEESRQWVEYCNGDLSTEYGRLRAERGHPTPYNVSFWSLGNEFGYGHMEGDNTASGYGKVALSHGKKMLEASPTLTFCSSGPYPKQEWVEQSARPLRQISSMISVHDYIRYPEFKDLSQIKQEYELCLSKIYTITREKLYETRRLLEDDSIKISLDEWNTWYAWYRGGNVLDGIYAASALHMIIGEAEKTGIDLACHFEAVNEGAIAIAPHSATLTPMGQMIALMKKHAGGKLCFASPDCIATRTDNVVTMTLLNRAYEKEKEFSLPSLGKVAVSRLYSSKEVTPGSCFTVTETLPDSEGLHSLLLPPHSVMLLQFQMDS